MTSLIRGTVSQPRALVNSRLHRFCRHPRPTLEMFSTQIAANPALPFTERLPGGFTHGATLQIDACLSPGASKFNLNIQDSFNGGNFTPLHLSARVTEGAIVRNHRAQGWGTEERHGGMPLFPGRHFRLTIDAEANFFKISINGVHFTTFNYRLGLESAQFINIHGDLQVFNVVLSTKSHQGPPPIAICPPFHPGAPTHPIQPPHHHHHHHHPHQY